MRCFFGLRASSMPATSTSRFGGQPDSSAIRAGTANLRVHLDYVGWLTERRTWLAGDQFSLADIAVGTLLRYLTVRWAAKPWREQYPNLAAYSDRLELRSSFKNTVPVPQVIRDRVA